MKTLVIGSTGTVGQHVVTGLVDRGVEVRAASRQPLESGADSSVEFVRLDLQAPDTLESALRGVDRVFALAPSGHVDPRPLLSPLVEVAGQVSKFVLMTAQGVETSEEIPMRRLELDVERSARSFAFLRPTWFSHNFHTYWRAPIVEDGTIPLPAAESRTAFIDARDIAACAVACLLEDNFEGQGWELTGPEGLTYAEAAEILSEVAGRKIRYQHVDDDTFRAGLARVGLASEYAELLVQLFAEVRGGIAERCTDSVLKLTGRPPRDLRSYANDHRSQWL